MIHRILKKVTRMIVYLLIAAVLILGVPTLAARFYALSKSHPLKDSPSAPVAIVFGAGLLRDGSPSPILRDRVGTASALYLAGKVDKILMSGDNRFANYNEPQAMKDFALELGIPAEDIVLDYAGRRTYDTCYRAKRIFGVDQALLITQDYHLPRALVTCNALGVKSEGIKADQRAYNSRSLRYWKIREIPATLVAFVDVYITRPLPVLGNPEPIFPDKLSMTIPFETGN